MYRHKILTRRETADIWEKTNPILKKNEMGVEIILNKDRTISHYNIKLGDNINPWVNLPYYYENLNETDTAEIIDDFVINISTRKPIEDFIAMYGEGGGLKSGKEPVEDNDVLRLKDLTDIGTSIPTPNKLVKYNEDAGLKSDKVPDENNDVARYSEVSVINNEISTINNKLSTLNGAYYVLDSYDFGKAIDETNPDDIHILNTYAIANTPGASSMADVYNDTVIINEFDTSEFVYNKIADIWVKYPNGYLTIATNEHLGVVKGTDITNGFVSIKSNGIMNVNGFSDLSDKLDTIESGAQVNKIETVETITPDANKNITLTRVFTTDAAFIAENPSIPPGTRVVKLYENPVSEYIKQVDSSYLKISDIFGGWNQITFTPSASDITRPPLVYWNSTARLLHIYWNATIIGATFNIGKIIGVISGGPFPITRLQRSLVEMEGPNYTGRLAADLDITEVGRVYVYPLVNQIEGQYASLNNGLIHGDTLIHIF
jgi:hypothetical protein